MAKIRYMRLPSIRVNAASVVKPTHKSTLSVTKNVSDKQINAKCMVSLVQQTRIIVQRIGITQHKMAVTRGSVAIFVISKRRRNENAKRIDDNAIAMN